MTKDKRKLERAIDALGELEERKFALEQKIIQRVLDACGDADPVEYLDGEVAGMTARVAQLEAARALLVSKTQASP